MLKILFAFIAFTAFFTAVNGVELKFNPPKITVKKALITPRIDATLEDPAWQNAVEISKLADVQNPEEGQPAIQTTKVKLLWNEKYLFVRFYCTDDDIYCTESGRDAPYYNGDVSEVFIDPIGDGMTYYEIQVSPFNGVMDVMTVMSAKPEFDETGRLTGESAGRNMNTFIEYNMSGFKSASAIQADKDGKVTGWITDFAIPADVIMKRYGKKEFEPVTLRANFVRYDRVAIKGVEERFFTPQNWAPTQRGCPHLSAAAMGYVKLEN